MQKPMQYGTKKRSGRGLTDARAIEEAALRHLARYDSSAANLRDVLRRKLRRSLDEGRGGDADELFPAIDALVLRLVERRLVDDQRYAEAVVRRLRRRGGSRARVHAYLAARGVADETIRQCLAGAEDSAGGEPDIRDPELWAACRFARRRRLGPWSGRSGDERSERRERELGALARAGFSFDIAERIVEGASVEAVEAACRG